MKLLRPPGLCPDISYESPSLSERDQSSVASPRVSAHCRIVATLLARVTSTPDNPLFRHEEPRAWENAVIREKFKHSSSKNISNRK